MISTQLEVGHIQLKASYQYWSAVKKLLSSALYEFSKQQQMTKTTLDRRCEAKLQKPQAMNNNRTVCIFITAPLSLMCSGHLPL